MGSPVNHSLSPYIHNTLADKLSDDLIYVVFDVKSDKLGMAVKGAYAMGVAGLNITFPHKTDVAEYVVSLDELSIHSAAINTLSYSKDGYIGYNTDIIGVEKSFAHHGVEIAGRTAVVYAAGGAGRSAAIALARMKCKKIIIVNRTKNKAEFLAELLKKHYTVDVEICEPKDFCDVKAHVLIQALSLGIGDISDFFSLPNSQIVRNYDVVFDMNYFPLENKLIKDAKTQGIYAFNGIEMLVYQAAAAYEIFHNKIISQDIIDELIYSIRR